MAPVAVTVVPRDIRGPKEKKESWESHTTQLLVEVGSDQRITESGPHPIIQDL
jgi:hypothetical protein